MGDSLGDYFKLYPHGSSFSTFDYRYFQLFTIFYGKYKVSVNSRPIRNRATICGSPAIQDQYMSATGALPKNASTASPMASRNASSAIQEQVE